jgi:hypothetical protein
MPSLNGSLTMDAPRPDAAPPGKFGGWTARLSFLRAPIGYHQDAGARSRGAGTSESCMPIAGRLSVVTAYVVFAFVCAIVLGVF